MITILIKLLSKKLQYGTTKHTLLDDENAFNNFIRFSVPTHIVYNNVNRMVDMN